MVFQSVLRTFDDFSMFRTNSFKDNDKYMRTKSGTYVRRDSDSYNRKESTGMPDFRSGIQERLQKSKDQLPQGLMREVLETYKPNLLTRRRR